MATLYGLARIGRDAEMRYTPGGDAVANLALAFSYGRKGDDGCRPTQWVYASLWGKRAEMMAQYLTKGGLVMVTVEDVHIEEYQRNGGGTGSKLVGRVSDIQFAGGKTEQRQEQPRSAPSSASYAEASGARPGASRGPAQSDGVNFYDGDDIPF